MSLDVTIALILAIFAIPDRRIRFGLLYCCVFVLMYLLPAIFTGGRHKMHRLPCFIRAVLYPAPAGCRAFQPERDNSCIARAAAA